MMNRSNPIRQQREAQKQAAKERRGDIQLAKPVIRALGQGPVAVVITGPDRQRAEEKRKSFLSGVKHSFPPSNVLQLRAARVQRLDDEGEHVEDTLDKLRQFRRLGEHSKAAQVVVFTGTRFPQPETIDRIGRGTPEVVERVTNMITNRGPNDPRVLFVGNGTPNDMPSSRDFPRDLDRGILDLVPITYALDTQHGLTTALPVSNEAQLLVPRSVPHKPFG